MYRSPTRSLSSQSQPHAFASGPDEVFHSPLQSSRECLALALFGSAPQSLIDVSSVIWDSGIIGMSSFFCQVRVHSVTSLGTACTDGVRSLGGPDRSG